MNFDITTEQRLLDESARRFMQEQHNFSGHSARLDDAIKNNKAAWEQFAGMGWLALPFAEADGGLGCGQIEIMLLMQSFGRGLVVAPFLPTIIFGGEILRRNDFSPARQQRISDIINGACTLAVAYAEKESRYELTRISTTATKTSGGWLVSGDKSVVLNGEHATHLIVSARTSGSAGDREGISLFWLPSNAPGVCRRGYPLLDGSRGADISFENVKVASEGLIGNIGCAHSMLEHALDASIAALGAEALGIMDALIEQTISYCQTRQQFGTPIGKFQGLQHRLVDMFMDTEQTRSLVYLANIRLAEAGTSPNATGVQQVISAMKAQVGKAGRFVGQEAIQLHGGMGMSNDFIVGHYFKRLTAIDATFGNVDFHLQRFAALKTTQDKPERHEVPATT